MCLDQKTLLHIKKNPVTQENVMFFTNRINEKLRQIIGGNRVLKSKIVRKNNKNHKQSGQ